MVAAMISALNRGLFSGAWFSPMVRALHQRAGFLRQRMNMLDRVVVPTALWKICCYKWAKARKSSFLPFWN